MGNKHSKGLYEQLASQVEPVKKICKQMDFQCLTEETLVKFLSKISSDHAKVDLPAFIKSLKLNSLPEEKKEEKEEKEKALQETQLHSLLASGHELLPDVRAIFEGANLEDQPPPQLSSVQQYSQQMVLRFVTYLILLLSKAESEKELPSFYDRVAHYLGGGSSSQIEGTSSFIALHLSGMLIDQTKLMGKQEVSSSLLDLFRSMNSLSLCGYTKEALMVDNSIELLRKCILAQIEDAGKDKDTAARIPGMIKTLCYIGLARGSVSDLLLALKYWEAYPPDDLSDVLKRVVQLPLVSSAYSLASLKLSKKAIEFEVPFEKLNYLPEDWIKDNSVPLSCAANSEYVCFYSGLNGLILIGAGGGKLMGKIYSECKAELGIHKLLTIKNDFYYWDKRKLFSIATDTMTFAECEKEVPANAKALTSTSDCLVTYSKLEEEEGKIKAELRFLDFSTMAEKRRLEITHREMEVKDIAVCGNIVVLIGGGKYELYDFSLNKMLKSKDSALLKMGTICVNPANNEVFAVFNPGSDSGFVLAKLKSMSVSHQRPAILEAKFQEACKLMADHLKDDAGATKGTIHRLLGFAQSEAKPGEAIIRVDLVLALMASRSQDAENLLDNISTSSGEEIIKVHKIPAAVHLTEGCFTTVLELITEYFRRAQSSKVYEDMLYCMVCILRAHLKALRTCNLSFRDCAGERNMLLFTDVCRTVLEPTLKAEAMKNEWLRSACEEVLEATQMESASIAPKDVAAAIAGAIQHKEQRSLRNIASWLLIPQTIDGIAMKLLKGDKECLDLLHTYFNLESAYLRLKLAEFLDNTKKCEGDAVAVTLHMLSPAITKLLDKASLFIGSQLEEKKVQLQVLLEPLYPPFKQMMGEIKGSYGKYKARLLGDSEKLLKSGEFGAEYGRYWKIIENLLEKELVMFYFLSLVLTLPMGTHTVPEQSLRLGQILMRYADELKAVFGELHAEKEADPGTQKLFPLYTLDEYYTNSADITKDTITEEKEYLFPGASGIHITVMGTIDIPSKSPNGISLIDPKKSKTLHTITAENNAYDTVIKQNHLKLSAKLEISDKKLYKGYRIRVRPKYSFGQSILKATLRNILWTSCFIAKSAQMCFEAEEKPKANLQIVRIILGSQLLSGGLPSACFQRILSPAFNKRYATIKEELSFDDSYDTPLDEKEVEEFKRIMEREVEGSGKVFKLLKELQKKKQPFIVVTDPLSEAIIQYTFTLLLKITDNLGTWKTACSSEEPVEAGIQKLTMLWLSASRMMLWITEKKRHIADSEEDFEKAMKEIVKAVKEKVHLLLYFRSVESSEQEGLKTKKSITLVRTESEEIRSVSEAEQIKTRLNKWKDIQKAVTHRESEELSLTAAAIQFLQSDISCSQLTTHIENYYLKAIVLYGAMSLCERACAFVFSRQIRADILAWIASIFKTGRMGSWHYSQQTTACGASFQHILRAVFFDLIKHVLDYIIASKTYKELPVLMDAIKWNYSARDHAYLKDCKLLSKICISGSSGYVSSLWGKPLEVEGNSPDIMLDTFEYIVMKVVTRALLKSDQKTEDSTEFLPGLQKSMSVLDESSTSRITETIIGIIFSQLNKAVLSYEECSGVGEEQVKEYQEMIREPKKKDKAVDEFKIKQDFIETQKHCYSATFCTRVLRLLYRLLVAIQEDTQMKTRVCIQMDDKFYSYLYRLLFCGSVQHQFLVLQTISVFATISLESLESSSSDFIAVHKPPIKRYTPSCLMDLLVAYALRNREGIWINKPGLNTSNYSMSKFAINTIRGMMNRIPGVEGPMKDIIKVLLFGTREEVMALNPNCRERAFMELMLSIAGGECEGLYKGSKGYAKEQRYVITSFVSALKDKPKVFDWGYQPKPHNELLIHLAEEKNSIGESSLSTIPTSQFLPCNEPINLSDCFHESIVQGIIEHQPGSHPLLETLSTQMMRIFLQITESMDSPMPHLKELIHHLLPLALQNPTGSTNKVLVVTEMIAEEMRKAACEAENSPLECTDRNVTEMQIKSNQLVVQFRSSYLILPIRGYTGTVKKLVENKREFLLYDGTTAKEDAEDRFVIVQKHEDLNVERLRSLGAYCIVGSMDVKSFPDKSLPYLEIKAVHIQEMGEKLKKLVELGTQMNRGDIGTLMAEYMGIKTEESMAGLNPNEVLKKLVKGEEEVKVKKEEKPVEEETKDIFEIYSLPPNKLEYIFGNSNDSQIREEKENLKKSFASSFATLFSSTGHPSVSSYLSTLADLRIFYARHILMNLLEHNLEVLTPEMKQQFFALLMYLSLEADYLALGFGSKVMSERVNKLIAIFIQVPEAQEIFSNWLNKKMETINQTKKNKGYTMFTSAEKELNENVSARFVYRYLSRALATNSISLIGHTQIADVITHLIKLMAIVRQVPEQYRFARIAKAIMGNAITLKDKLRPEQITRILTCKGIQALSEYYRQDNKSTSIIWRNGIEVIQTANVLLRYGIQAHGECVQSACLKNDTEFYIQLVVMKEFPNMKKLLTQIWFKLYNKDYKSKCESRIDSPKPFYKTMYRLMIQDPLAQSLDVSIKKQSESMLMMGLDRKMKAIIHSVTEEKKDLSVDFNRVYVTFPYEGYKVYTFGSNDSGRMGLKEAGNVTEPVLVPEIGKEEVLGIYSSGGHTLINCKPQKMYCSGKGSGKIGGENNVFKAEKQSNAGSVAAVSKSASVYYQPSDENFIAYGKNPDRMFCSSSKSISGNTFRTKGVPIQISISEEHAVYLVKPNVVYVSPIAKKELFGGWMDGSESEYNKLTLPKEVTVVHQVLALNGGTILLCEKEGSAKKLLLSYGKETEQSMGQGEKVNQDQYTRLSYPEELEFASITGNVDMAAGITDKGELYTWGKAGGGGLGHFDPEGKPVEEMNVPKKVEGLEDYKIQQVSVGLNHMLLLVENKEGKRKVVGMGDNKKGQLGSSDTNLTRNEIAFFDGRRPYLVSAGFTCSFVACEKEGGIILHRDTQCKHHTNIPDTLYFIKEKSGKLKCWCQECVGECPPVVLATQYPISDITTRPWPEIEELKEEERKEEVKCNGCGEKISGAVYKSAVKESPNLFCKECFEKTPASFTPVIYYRCASANYPFESLPSLSLAQFYEVSNDTVSLVIKPDYQLDFPESSVDPAIKPSLAEFLSESEGFQKEHDIDLIELINDYLMDNKKEMESVNMTEELSIPYYRRNSLRQFKEEPLSRRGKMLIELNKMLLKAINYIDFSSSAKSEEDLYVYYMKVKDYLASMIKEKITKQAMKNLPKVKNKTSLKLERHKAFMLRSQGQVDYTGQRSLFSQVWRAMKDKVNEFQKEPKSDSYPFSVEFKTEGGSDAGGLFRETMDHISEELQSSCLPLLIPTPNNKTGFGLDRDKFIVNPSCRQSMYLEMYEFFGALLGMCFRLSHLIPLSLPSMFWKQIIGDPLDKSDLSGIDSYSTTCLNDLEKPTTDVYLDLSFVTTLSDGTEVELKKNGKSEKVLPTNKKEYLSLVLKARLEEGSAQMKAIRAGMEKVVPQSILKLLSWKDVEVKICGKPSYKVESLKKITRYEGCKDTDSHVQIFWQVLEEFNDEERAQYLRFVWGRSRMPGYLEKYSHVVAKKNTDRPDDTLPESHTCFFQLDLPRYTSVEKCKEKFLIAFRCCQSIDGDNTNVQVWED